jgi:hypothetical protein
MHSTEIELLCFVSARILVPNGGEFSYPKNTLYYILLYYIILQYIILPKKTLCDCLSDYGLMIDSRFRDLQYMLQGSLRRLRNSFRRILTILMCGLKPRPFADLAATDTYKRAEIANTPRRGSGPH